MDLIWWLVAILGCVALAGCVASALLWPGRGERARPRPLANTGRLTRLPEYVRAVRWRTISAVVSIGLLGLALAATVLVAARPTGLPSSDRNAEAAQPEDIMVWVGGQGTDPTVGSALRYFADRVGAFGTERIGLTSANRRAIPLTRDYQYAAAQFGRYAEPPQRRDGPPLVSAVSYADYSAGVEDVLSLCLTGFPSFDQPAAQRRSLIYIGPDALGSPDGTRPQLFTSDRVGELAIAAGVQVNILSTGAAGDGLSGLASDTGGRSYSTGSDVTASLDETRRHPPAPVTGAATATRSAESPGAPVIVALLALTAMALWPLVVRR